MGDLLNCSTWSWQYIKPDTLRHTATSKLFSPSMQGRREMILSQESHQVKAQCFQAMGRLWWALLGISGLVIEGEGLWFGITVYVICSTGTGSRYSCLIIWCSCLLGSLPAGQVGKDWTGAESQHRCVTEYVLNEESDGWGHEEVLNSSSDIFPSSFMSPG